MKRLLVTSALFLLTAGLACAQTSAPSRNAVGYVNRSVPVAFGFDMASVPFVTVNDGGLKRTINEVMGTQLTGNNSFALAPKIFVFSTTGQTFEVYFKHGTGEWRKQGSGTQTPDTLQPGQSFFLQLGFLQPPTNVFLMGEVPTNDALFVSMPSNSFAFSSLGFPYPTAVAVTNLNFTNAEASATRAFADKIYLWSTTGQSYQVYFLHGTGEWRKQGTITSTPDVIQPGDGGLYQRAFSFVGLEPIDLEELKPYTYPGI